jgi:hypothetical protein
MGYACDGCSTCGDESPGIYAQPEIHTIHVAGDQGAERYKDADPIKASQRIVFQVNWESGEKWLLINHPDVTIDKVVEALRDRYPDSKFKVGQIDVGAFRLATPCVPDKEVVYRSDTRWVTQDGYVEM